MKRKVFGLISMALCCFAACTGCGSNGAKDITLVSGNECKFVIVGDADADYVKAVAEKFNTLSGNTPDVYAPDDAPEEMAQVVIANPNTVGVEEIVSEVPYFGYLIRVWDGNVYILAYDEAVIKEAVIAFLAEMDSLYANGKLKVEGSYVVSKSTSETFGAGEAPFLEGGKNAQVFDCDNGYQMVLLEGVAKNEFEGYCNKLVSDGYSLYAENEINGNLFKTYTTKDGVLLHTYWTEYFNEVRTVVAKDAVLPEVNAPEIDDVCTTLLHQFKALNEDQIDGGMGYAIRLSDGRFIIIDGGKPTTENRDAIYNFLKANAPDPDNIVIAAWYITHAHNDHGGVFPAFAKEYAKDHGITLESVMFNPCDTYEQMKYCTSITMELEDSFATYYPNAKIYKPLTGQVYRFAKTSIEVLYTMEDYLPNTIPNEQDGIESGQKKGDYNIQSVVSIIDLDSTADKKDRLFVMGDITTIACNEMCYRYGSYMKCDYVQVSHHGLAPLPTGPNCRRHGATVEIYQYIDADIALWPSGEEKVKERSVLEVNEALISIVDEVIIAGKGEHTIEFK